MSKLTFRFFTVLALLALSGCDNGDTQQDLGTSSQALQPRNFDQVGGEPWANYQVISNPVDKCTNYGRVLAVGEVNGDGKPDIISSLHHADGTRELDLYWGNSHSRVTMLNNNKPALDGLGTALRVGAFCPDLEARGDIVVASAPDYAGGRGGFGLVYRKPAVKTHRRMTHPDKDAHAGTAFTVADMDGDGKNDLIFQALRQGKSSIEVQSDFCHGGSDMKISAYVMGGESFGDVIEAADLDGNGVMEIVSYDSALKSLVFYRWKAGQLVSSRTALPLEDTVSVNALALSDLDGDGKRDILIADAGYAGGKGRIMAYLNSDAGFGESSWQATGQNNGDGFGYAMVAADLNADHVTELMVGIPRQHAEDDTEAEILVMMGTRDGTLFSKPF